jgi:hypothetical protein
VAALRQPRPATCGGDARLPLVAGGDQATRWAATPLYFYFYFFITNIYILFLNFLLDFFFIVMDTYRLPIRCDVTD